MVLLPNYLRTFLPLLVLVILLGLSLAPAEASSYASDYNRDYYRSHNGRSYAQPRTLFARARSIMPRFADVAAETATALAFPALIVLAVSALWPEHYHYHRVKRGAGEAINPTEELSEHMMNIYFAAMESDQCLQRVVCELGASARTLKPGSQEFLVSMLGSVASKKYSNLFEKFKGGVNAERCQKIGCAFMDN